MFVIVVIWGSFFLWLQIWFDCGKFIFVLTVIQARRLVTTMHSVLSLLVATMLVGFLGERD